MELLQMEIPQIIEILQMEILQMEMLQMEMLQIVYFLISKRIPNLHGKITFFFENSNFYKLK